MTSLHETLVTALQKLGCNTSQFQFDTHSTIVMSFSDIGELLFDPVGDTVSLWSTLATAAGNGFGGRAQELLTLLSEPIDYMQAGCIALREAGDHSFVGGSLAQGVLEDAGRMADAIEAFHARTHALQAVLK